MFKYAPENKCYWPVDLPERTAEGGIELVRVLVLYRLLTRAELKQVRRDLTAFARQLAANRDAGPEAIERFGDLQEQQDTATAEDLRGRILGWKGIAGPDSDDDLPYSDQVRDWLLADEARFKALRQGLLEASRGAVAKN